MRELYSNALPIEGMRYPLTTFIRGKEVSFTRDEINGYLDNPLNLEEGEEYAYYKRVHRADWNIELVKEALIFPGRSYVVIALGLPVKFRRKDMNVNAQVLTTLLLYNIGPMSHTSSIPIDTYCLLYYILDKRKVNVAQVISNEIRMISSSGHRLGTRTLATLAFPRLIMGLCRRVGVAIPSVVHGTIEGVLNYLYILRHCTPR